MNHNRNVVEAWFEAFQTKELSKLALSDDFVHSSPFGDVRGRTTYLELVRANREAFFANEIEIIDIFEDDKKFCVRYLVNERPACDCFYLRDGKISKIYSYYHFGEKPEMPSTEKYFTN